MDDQSYRRARRMCSFLIYFPACFLGGYFAISLIVFNSSPAFRALVDLTPVHVSWIAEVFPVLHKYQDALPRTETGLSLGYYFHAYLIGLTVSAAAMLVVVARYPTLKAVALEQWRRAVSRRRKFDGREAAAASVATATFVILLALVWGFWLGGLYKETAGLRPFRNPGWVDSAFFLYAFPMWVGLVPAVVVAGVVNVMALASPVARTFNWGADAVREGAASGRPDIP